MEMTWQGEIVDSSRRLLKLKNPSEADRPAAKACLQTIVGDGCKDTAKTANRRHL